MPSLATITPASRDRRVVLSILGRVVRRTISWACTLTMSLLALVGVMTLTVPTSFICSAFPDHCTTRAAAEASGQLPRLIAPPGLLNDARSPSTSKAGSRRVP